MTRSGESTLFNQNPYECLGLTSTASLSELKNAYRALVKKHHPDTGGDAQKILELNAAWELLSDPEKRRAFDRKNDQVDSAAKSAQKRMERNASASVAASEAKGRSIAMQEAIEKWMSTVYIPVDRLLGQIINPLSKEIQSLSADPYDDILMNSFCMYIEKSQNKLNRIKTIYLSIATPNTISNFSNFA